MFGSQDTRKGNRSTDRRLVAMILGCGPVCAFLVGLVVAGPGEACLAAGIMTAAVGRIVGSCWSGAGRVRNDPPYVAMMAVCVLAVLGALAYGRSVGLPTESLRTALGLIMAAFGIATGTHAACTVRSPGPRSRT